MPTNPKREEDFCVNIVRGLKPSQAAMAAGYAPGYSRSDGPANLLRRPHIMDRIEVLRAKQATALSYDVARIVRELEDVQARAKTDGKYADEVRSIIAKAELLGIKKDANIDVNIIYKPVGSPTKKLDLTVEEWQELWSPKELGHNGHG